MIGGTTPFATAWGWDATLVRSDPPLLGWSGPDEKLIAVLETAIRDGHRMTYDDMIRASGFEVPRGEPGDIPPNYAPEDAPSRLRRALDHYKATFGEWPPLFVWNGTRKQLQELCESAIKAGKPLTMDDLIRAQGAEPAPLGAIY